jgi:hypothetical protein
MNELRIQSVEFVSEEIAVQFNDQSTLALPLSCFPRLQKATPKQRTDWALIGLGLGIHWPEVDEDLSVENFLSAAARQSKTSVSAG